MKKKFKLKKIPGRHLLEYLVLRFVSAFIDLLPIEVATWMARRLGDVLLFFMAGRKKIAIANLDRVYGRGWTAGKKREIAREAFLNLVTSLMEFFRIPVMLKEASGRFEFEGTEHLDRAFARGNGIIFCISHLGSWEYLAFLPFLKKYPCSVVVRDIRNPYIDRWIRGLREETKLKPINRAGAIKKVMAELRSNHLVAILTDQWAGHDGLWVDFLGHPTSTTSLPIRLARRTGAAMIEGYCLRTKPGRYKIVIKPEIPVGGEDGRPGEKKATLQLNDQLAAEIRKYPEQWIWTHRRWKSQRQYLTA